MKIGTGAGHNLVKRAYCTDIPGKWQNESTCPVAKVPASAAHGSRRPG
jgi:hypothetical protein